MIVVDVLLIALTTIGILVLLQLITFFVARVLHPPAPQIIYRNAPIPMQEPPPVMYHPPPMQHQGGPPPPIFTQPDKEQKVDLPDYDIRKSSSTSLRLDTGLPDGIQETRPPGV